MATSKNKNSKQQLTKESITNLYDFLLTRPLGYSLGLNAAQTLIKIKDELDSKGFNLEKIVSSNVEHVMPKDATEQSTAPGIDSSLSDLCFNEIVFMVESKMLAGVKLDYADKSVKVKADAVKIRRNGTSFIKKFEKLSDGNFKGNEYLKNAIELLRTYADVMLEQFKDETTSNDDVKSCKAKASLDCDDKSSKKEDSKASSKETAKKVTAPTEPLKPFTNSLDLAKYVYSFLNENTQLSFAIAGIMVLVINGLNSGKIKKDKNIIQTIKNLVEQVVYSKDFDLDDLKAKFSANGKDVDADLIRRITGLILQLLASYLIRGISITFTSVFNEQMNNLNIVVKASKLGVQSKGLNFVNTIASAQRNYKGKFGDESSKTLIKKILLNDVVSSMLNDFKRVMENRNVSPANGFNIFS